MQNNLNSKTHTMTKCHFDLNVLISSDSDNVKILEQSTFNFLTIETQILTKIIDWNYVRDTLVALLAKRIIRTS